MIAIQRTSVVAASAKFWEIAFSVSSWTAHFLGTGVLPFTFSLETYIPCSTANVSRCSCIARSVVGHIKKTISLHYFIADFVGAGTVHGVAEESQVSAASSHTVALVSAGAELAIVAGSSYFERIGDKFSREDVAYWERETLAYWSGGWIRNLIGTGTLNADGLFDTRITALAARSISNGRVIATSCERVTFSCVHALRRKRTFHFFVHDQLSESVARLSQDAEVGLVSVVNFSIINWIVSADACSIVTSIVSARITIIATGSQSSNASSVITLLLTVAPIFIHAANDIGIVGRVDAEAAEIAGALLARNIRTIGVDNTDGTKTCVCGLNATVSWHALTISTRELAVRTRKEIGGRNADTTLAYPVGLAQVARITRSREILLLSSQSGITKNVHAFGGFVGDSFFTDTGTEPVTKRSLFTKIVVIAGSESG